MAIYIEITKHYETHEKVAYLYSRDHISWGEFLIIKDSLDLESVKELEGEKQKFFMFRAWGKVRRTYLTTGVFPQETCYAA
ncbi:hypothetical protein ACMXLN_005106 [Escherichia coli]|uniref:hypothetical protein n=1 Tax=Escherichia coli TaxID=562 RepID=UPI000543B2C5|nr:hypothetical protein [Escherichia coli]EEU9363036.1 hypothetical protein [Escherichia coli]EEU9366369.1 hypothetical protein [Escherichia coli]EFA5287382.1 hypothetical protein [Escherichia coli]EFA5288677.1 hypothetical protein [Escherichia coli]EFB4345801.1 hypothetical protein [Escherichia coli]